MKILHIAEFGSSKNGVGTVVERLFLEQTALGHDVKIATTEPNIVYKDLDLNYVKTKYDIKKILNYWTPDAVLFHSIWTMPYISFAKVLKKEDIPYAVMMHGANSLENSKKGYWKKLLCNKLWFNKFLSQASSIIYLSQKELELCVSKDFNKNNIIIPNGCDSVNIEINRKSKHCPIDIIYLGRLALHHKGIDYLLEAIKILQNKGVNGIHIHFYGNENDQDAESIQDSLSKLDGIASYEGPAYAEKKKQVLKNADTFILTSRYEGMPMGVLEALSYGVPCILTPGTNMAEDVVAAGAGWKAELNSNSIANTIERAVVDLQNDYHQYHEAAYKMSKRYDWKIIAKQHVEVMERIASKQI